MNTQYFRKAEPPAAMKQVIRAIHITIELVFAALLLVTMTDAIAGPVTHTFYRIDCETEQLTGCKPYAELKLIVNPAKSTIQKHSIPLDGSKPYVAELMYCEVADENNFSCPREYSGDLDKLLSSQWTLSNGTYLTNSWSIRSYFVTPFEYYRRKLMNRWDK